MAAGRKKKSSDEDAKKESSSSARRFIESGAIRYIVFLGIIAFYVFYLLSVPASDLKAVMSILALLIAVMVFLHTDSGLIKFVRDTRTTVGLTAGLIGLAVGLVALVVGIVTVEVLYLMLSAFFLIVFTPLFFYKLYVTLRTGYNPIDPLVQMGIVILLTSIAFFLLSPNAALSVIDIFVILVGAIVYSRGTKREKRRAELASIAAHTESSAVDKSS